MFTTEHFIWIAICIAFIIGMLLFCIKNSCSTKLNAVAAIIISSVSAMGRHSSRKVFIFFIVFVANHFIKLIIPFRVEK